MDETCVLINKNEVLIVDLDFSYCYSIAIQEPIAALLKEYIVRYYKVHFYYSPLLLTRLLHAKEKS